MAQHSQNNTLIPEVMKGSLKLLRLSSGEDPGRAVLGMWLCVYVNCFAAKIRKEGGADSSDSGSHDLELAAVIVLNGPNG